MSATRRRQKVWTVQAVERIHPCGRYPPTRIRRLLGRRGKTTLQILSMQSIPVADRLWFAWRALTRDQRKRVALAIHGRIPPIFQLGIDGVYTAPIRMGYFALRAEDFSDDLNIERRRQLRDVREVLLGRRRP